MQKDYWNLTDKMLENNERPDCPYCGKPMFPEDDHGRFSCLCEGYMKANRPKIPQITEDLPDEIKDKIPAINRLNLPPTKKDKEKLAELDSLFKDLTKPL